MGAEGANRRAGPVHGAELTVGPWQAGAAGRGAWRPNRPVCIVGPGPGCRSVGAGDTRGRTVPSGEPGWPFVSLRVPSGRKKRSGASACLPPRLRLRPRRPPTQIARRTFQTWQVKLGEVQIEWRLDQVCWTRGPDGAPALPLGHSVRSAAVTAHPRPPLGRPDPELRCSGCARGGLPAGAGPPSRQRGGETAGPVRPGRVSSRRQRLLRL